MALYRQLVALFTLFPVLLYATTALALDPTRAYYQYQYVGVPEDIDMPSNILDVVQDGDGLLWLATSRGLASFDGLEYTSYRLSRFPALLSNQPTRLYVDSNDRLFIASEAGLSLHENGQFRVLADEGEWSSRINAFAEDGLGTVFFGSDEGLWQFRRQTLSPVEQVEDIRQVHALLWHDNTLFVGARGSMFTLTADSVSATALPPRFERSRIRDFAVYNDQLWLATRRGLLVADGDAIAAYDAEPVGGKSVNRLLVDRDNNLWFISRRNVGRVLPGGATELPDVADEAMGFVPEFTQIVEDDRGRIWLSSSFFGLMGLRDTDVARVSYSEGLSSPNVTAIAAGNDGRVVVATDQGIDVLTADSMRTVVLNDFSGGAAIQTLLVDDGIVWTGADEGLKLFDLETGEAVASPLDGAEIEISSIAKSPNGGIWIAAKDNLFVTRGADLSSPIPLPGVHVNHLAFGPNGQMWLATDNGIARFENNSVRFVDDGSERLSRAFTSLEFLENGSVIGVTSDHGIAVFDGNAWTFIGESSGLPPEHLIDIEATNEQLWLITGSGVFRSTLPVGDNFGGTLKLEPVITTRRYRSPNGTLCCRGRGDATAVIVGNALYAATDDGVISAPLDIATTDSSKPSPYVQSLVAGGVSMSFPLEENPTLSWRDNNLRIHYSAKQLHDGGQVEFRYRLLGLSNEWVDNGRARNVEFQNLPPGDYTFELQASLQPGQWSESAGVFTFSRAARFTESASFNLAIWIAAIIATILLVWARLAGARRQHRLLEEQIQERTNALSDLNTELKSANKMLKKSSQTDPLTGLVNRRYFDNDDGHRLTDEIANRGLVMIIDIDFFKRVNDAYGHSAGDEVLCQFASVLRSCVRQSDLVIRWGGEEFVGICRCPNDDAKALLERVCDAVRAHSFIVPDGRRVELTCSVGGIRYPIWEAVSPDDRMPILMELADAALYEVKMSGRDGWALLEGGDIPYENPKSRYVGPRLGQLIDDGHLHWTSSGSEPPGLSLIDTQTRLRAIRSSRD